MAVCPLLLFGATVRGMSDGSWKGKRSFFDRAEYRGVELRKIDPEQALVARCVMKVEVSLAINKCSLR
jgi:hypothetical protein